MLLPVNAALLRLQRADERLCLALNATTRYFSVLHLFRAVSWLGNGIFWYALMLIFLLRDGERALFPVLHMIAVGALGTMIYSALKRRTARPRPYEVVPAVAMGAAPLDAFSFPSGHTLHAVAFTLVAASYYPAVAGVLGAFSALVAASRVVLGLHYPSDVAAGAAIGAVIAGASFGI
jgi:undecaprenyl-diphosphatase